MFTNFILCVNSYLTITFLLCFSTLRRLKTWVRNRMGNERLSSLGLINIHRQRYDDENFFNQQIDKSINLFASNKRRLSLLFE